MRRKKTIFLIIIFILSYCFISLNAVFYQLPYNNSHVNLNNKNPYLASNNDILLNTIILWPNPLDEIPSGWILCNGSNGTPDLTERFILSVLDGENPGITGGSKNHSHSYSDIPQHSHGINDPEHYHTISRLDFETVWIAGGTTTCAGPYTDTLLTGSSATGITINNTGINNCKTNEINTTPPYHKLAYITNLRTTKLIPENAILMWSGSLNSIPEGWALCNGLNETPDLTDRFILGARNGEDPGTTGGSQYHYHSYSDIPQHSHGINDPGHSHTYTRLKINIFEDAGLPGGGGEVANDNWEFNVSSSSPTTGITIQESGINNCTTDNASAFPPYYKLAYLMKKSNSSLLPKGMILIWAKSLDLIPEGLAFCNGSNWTPNLTDRFILSVGNGEDPGTNGGSKNHSHPYNDISLHTHGIDDPGHNHIYDRQALFDVIDQLGLIPPVDPVQVGRYDMNALTWSSLTGITIQEAGIDDCLTEASNSLPPYYKVAFVMNLNDVDLSKLTDSGEPAISFNFYFLVFMITGIVILLIKKNFHLNSKSDITF